MTVETQILLHLMCLYSVCMQSCYSNPLFYLACLSLNSPFFYLNCCENFVYATYSDTFWLSLNANASFANSSPAFLYNKFVTEYSSTIDTITMNAFIIQITQNAPKYIFLGCHQN